MDPRVIELGLCLVFALLCIAAYIIARRQDRTQARMEGLEDVVRRLDELVGRLEEAEARRAFQDGQLWNEVRSLGDWKKQQTPGNLPSFGGPAPYSQPLR